MKKNKLIIIPLLSGFITGPVIFSVSCVKNNNKQEDEIVLDKTVEEVKPNKDTKNPENSSESTPKPTETEQNKESTDQTSKNEDNQNDSNSSTNQTDNTAENNTTSEDGTDVNNSVENDPNTDKTANNQNTSEANVETARQNLMNAITKARKLQSKIDNSSLATYLSDWLKDFHLNNFIETSQRNYDASGSTYENLVSATNNLTKLTADAKVFYDHALKHILGQLNSNIDNTQGHVKSYKTYDFVILRNHASNAEKELPEANRIYNLGEQNNGLNPIIEINNKLINLANELIKDFNAFFPNKKRADNAIIEFIATQEWIWANRTKFTNDELNWSNTINNEIITLKQQMIDSPTTDQIQNYADQIVNKLNEYKNHLKVSEKGYVYSANN
ncbi:hypothetical protein [Mycoplasmopsis felifaucium]|uniref:Lipoprotein n=1 Tax=Mycoplasmopsis felifaucium TaxID=35768 RepID=A0ABZ2RVR4_9BACT